MSRTASLDRAGLTAALCCFVIWGLFPLLFDAMAAQGAGAWEIVGWRTVWSLPFALALVVMTGRVRAALALLRQPRALLTLILSAALIGANWSLYVWAVTAGHTIAASLGYFINPLLSLAMGRVLFGERVSRAGWVGVALACAGVAVQAVALKAVPWIPLLLALSFASYGAVRKRAVADAQTGLLMECLILGAPALVFVTSLALHGSGHFGRSAPLSGLLFLAGPATVAPLAAFAFAARRLPLSMVGFLQFITPTLQFVCGLVLGERLQPLSLLAFGLIWAGVLAFTLGMITDRSSHRAVGRPERAPRAASRDAAGA